MKFSCWFSVLALLVVGLLASSCASTNTPSTANPFGVRISHTNDVLRVELNGKLFTEYYYTNVPRPFCYPLLGPGGVAMTRNYPMLTNAPAEERDHPHHRSLWFAHGAVNGQDLWTEQNASGRIVHRGFTEIASGTQSGVIRTLNDWVDKQGKVLCTDEETFRFHAPQDDVTWLDFEITLRASNGDVTLGDTKEGTFAIRLAETMRLKPNKDNAGKPTGHIVNSAGVRDDKTWGKRAAWCDYYGPVGTNIVGLAIFDHPANPRHPTWWHVRDYGLFAANPFGQHDFESLSDQRAGDLKIPAGQSVTFRYRVVLHEGDEKKGRIAERYADYVKETSTNGK
ncbi:MAG: PmoA family protein [Verrucomicrobiota bacterium]